MDWVGVGDGDWVVDCGRWSVKMDVPYACPMSDRTGSLDDLCEAC